MIRFILVLIITLPLTIVLADEFSKTSVVNPATELDNIYREFDDQINLALTVPRDSAKQIYLDAEVFIEKVLVDHPHNSRIFSRAAVVNAQLVAMSGTSEQVGRIQKIDKYCLESLKLDSTNSVAMVIQGVLNYRLSNLSWLERFLANTFIGTLPDASYENSIFYLNKAISIDDKSPFSHFALGRTLLAVEDEQKAREQLEIAVSLAPQNEIDRRYQKKASHWLIELDNGNDFDLHSDGK